MATAASGRQASTAGAPVSADVFVSSEVELLQDMNREAGWQVEYRQLEPGHLRTASSLRQLGGFSILFERSDRRVELRAEPPKGMVSLVAPVAPDTMTFNGFRMERGGFAVFRPGAELIGVTHGPAEAWSLQIPAELFERHERPLDPDRGSAASGRATVVQASTAASVRLPRLLEAASSFDSERFAETELASELISAVAAGLRSDASAGPREQRGTPARHREILRIAREYIEANLDRPIRMPDVCLAAGTSLSTLERAFRHELELAPLTYIRLRRLNAVRAALLRPEARDRSISRIATDFGFGHLGRFSQAYRHHFGWLPSEARRSVAAPSD